MSVDGPCPAACSRLLNFSGQCSVKTHLQVILVKRILISDLELISISLSDHLHLLRHSRARIICGGDAGECDFPV